ncbi:hypothetical protein [Micromonospora sp. 067-2]|uniref:hypothetical protein n=1 Tax=Micromonospora sp. 067-2 TaxID=2789270 RepID=UPI00397B0392
MQTRRTTTRPTRLRRRHADQNADRIGTQVRDPANPTSYRLPTADRTRRFAPTDLQNSRTHGKLADTSREPAAVYRHLNRLTGIAEQAKIEVVRARQRR